MSHLRSAEGTILCEHEEPHDPNPLAPRLIQHEAQDEEYEHSHGLVDRSILRSRAGVRAVALSLLSLGLTAGAQVAIFVVSHSVALLADLIHNFGDALTAVPLGIAFLLRTVRGEKLAGLAVVLAIFVSASSRSTRRCCGSSTRST